jgi:hypothetical protein
LSDSCGRYSSRERYPDANHSGRDACSEYTAVVKYLAVIASLAVLSGCVPNINALAADKNPVCVKWSTPWGSGQMDRLFGCELPPTTTPSK